MGAKLVGMYMPSICLGQALILSLVEELVSPTRSLGLIRWRAISFNMPQVVKGWDETISISAPDFLKARA